MLDLLTRHVLAAEERAMNTVRNALDRVAVFDLDGTLISGDIGDAVFAYLILQGHRLSLNWMEYQQLLHSHRSKAYRTVVEAMAGLELRTVAEATKAVMDLKQEYLVIGHDRVTKPKPRLLLAQFVSLLRKFHYQVFVISASNHISVQLVAEEWFNIPTSHSFGIQGRVRDGRITTELVHPIPIGPGKTEVFKLAAGSAVPLITGTDSALDLPLLRLTDPIGFSLWVGDDRTEYEATISNANVGQRFVFAGSGEESPFDNF